MSERLLIPEQFPISVVKDNPNIIMVRQHTWGVTTAKSEFPLLKTHGLFDCVGVTIYDPKSHTAGLLHMDGAAQFRRKHYTDGPKEDILAMLHTMQNHGVVKRDINSLEAHVTNTFEIQPHILSFITKQLLIKLGVNKVITIPAPAITIDARSGKVAQLIDYIPSERYDESSNRTLQLSHWYKAVITNDKRSLH